MIKRLANRFLIALLASLLALVLFITCLPVTWLAPMSGEDDIVLLAGSRLYRGQALVEGQQWVRWQWCPERGVTAICTTLNGPNQYLAADLRIGFAGIRATAVTFSGFKAAAFGLRSLGPDAVVAGQIESVSVPWRAPCLKDLVTMEATLSASALGFPGLSGKTVDIAIQGNGKDGVKIQGESVWGDFSLVGGMMQGTLEIARDLVPPSAASLLKQTPSGYAIDISQGTPCQDEG